MTLLVGDNGNRLSSPTAQTSRTTARTRSGFSSSSFVATMDGTAIVWCSTSHASARRIDGLQIECDDERENEHPSLARKSIAHSTSSASLAGPFGIVAVQMHVCVRSLGVYAPPEKGADGAAIGLDEPPGLLTSKYCIIKFALRRTRVMHDFELPTCGKHKQEVSQVWT